MGPITKARNLISRLESLPAIDNEHDERTYSRLVSQAVSGLNAAWNNPAIADEAARAKSDLLDAWHDKLHPVTDEDIARHNATVQEQRDRAANR